MRDLHEVASLHEAQLLVDRLSERGIRTYVRNATLQGCLGELPLTVRPVVCITEPVRWAHAVRVLEEFQAAKNSTTDTVVTCAVCEDVSPSNFEVCWKCRAPF